MSAGSQASRIGWPNADHKAARTHRAAPGALVQKPVGIPSHLGSCRDTGGWSLERRSAQAESPQVRSRNGSSRQSLPHPRRRQRRQPARNQRAWHLLRGRRPLRLDEALRRRCRRRIDGCSVRRRAPRSLESSGGMSDLAATSIRFCCTSYRGRSTAATTPPAATRPLTITRPRTGPSARSSRAGTGAGAIWTRSRSSSRAVAPQRAFHHRRS